MNERIKQLADEARIKPMGSSWAYRLADEFEEEFAQLIVKECARIADTERPNSVGCGYITKTNGMRIKEHFGVEQ
jgi:hypothetical protein